MSTNANPVASFAGQLAGQAASGPLGAVAAIGEAAKGIIGMFVTDPSKKLEASQHLLDLQQELNLAAIDQQNKIMSAASENQKNDVHASGARAYFCYGITTLLLVNYGLAPFAASMFHWAFTPFAIPMYVMGIFATIMLGWVGIPAGADLVNKVMSMSGDSQVSMLGVAIKQNNVTNNKEG